MEDSESEEDDEDFDEEMGDGPPPDGMEENITDEIGVDGRTMLERKALAKYLTKKPYHLKDKMVRYFWRR